MGPHPDRILKLAQWVHIQITFWNSLISRIPTILTIQSVGRFTCLLFCIVRIVGIFFLFHTCLGFAGIEGTAFHSYLCMKCVERIGLERSEC